MFDLTPAVFSGGPRSDPHGVSERDPPLGVSRPAIDQRDFATNEPVAEHDPQIPAVGCGRAPFKVPDRASKLDAFADKLTAWLKLEGSRPRKQKRTVKQLHADLVALGFDVSYGRVSAFARAWKTERQREQQTAGRGAFVPLVFQPGEAFQFDWSEDWAIIGGERTKLRAAHSKLCYSRAFIVRANLLQTHEMLFDAHGQAFRVFGGVPRHLRQHAHCR
jgi:hypothetical protein